MDAGPLRAECFCGAVELEILGTPRFLGYCHCESCRTWLGAPVHAATLWASESVRVVRGAELLGTYSKRARSQRQHCTRCGGSVLNAHPGEGLVDVMASLIRSFSFEPTMHVHYAERVVSMADGLPKYRDLPAEWGGSDVRIPESDPA